MKLRTKSIITLVTMLLSGIGAFAADGTGSPQWTVSYQYDGEASTSNATGIVECTFSGTTATIVCKPVEGNYITAEDIIVEKTVSGDKAQTRETGISTTPITITAASTNTTPRAESSYTFTAEADPNLIYQIKANFHQLKDLDTYAQIALPENTIYTYTGQDIEPEFTVTAAGVNLTAGTDYTVTYANNINAGQGSITITATTTTFYSGSRTVNFYINQADVSFWFETSDGQEAKELTTTYGATFTKPVLKMSETGAADVIGVVYSVDNKEVATINATTGELTILKAGTVVVTAAAAENYTNKEGSNYKADPTNTKASYSLTINSATPTLQFSKETAEATMGAEFEAPTLTVTPEGLVPIEYESTNTEVATVDKNTGVVTLVGKGEATIKAVFPGNENYETALASYILTVSNATMEVSATGYEGVYDGNAHGITVTAPEGATVKYGTEEGKYDLTENPTYTNVGTYTVYYQVTKEATETVTGSAKITITKATATLKFSAETATATLGAEFQTPTLTVTPEGLEGVKYTSSNTDVATVHETTGAVTLVAAGETTITAKFAGNDNYEAAETSYTLTVNSKATMEVTATGYEGVYDGNAHGITVTAPEGATVKYGTEEGKYDLTENPTYTNVGTYTVYYQVTKEATETVTGSAKITITKATATLKFSAETATATLGAEFQTPTLTVTPEGLEGVKYTSSNTDVATVHETTGAVTLVAAGETTITAKFAGNDNYEAAETSYTLTVNRAQSEGYGLWINDIQVTEDNQDDVLGNSADSKSGTMGTIVFNPEKNTLIMTNEVSNVEIESRLESLTLHINDANQVKRIFYNNLGDATKTGKLAITTNGNFPGQLLITNDAGKSAISGFSELTLEQDLLFVEPELVELKNGELYQYDFKKVDPTDPESKLIKDDATEAICNAVTIGVIITPLTQNVTVLLSKGDDFIVKDANGNPVTDTNGNPVPASLKNFALSKDILLTIWTEVDEQNSQAGQEVDAGFDDSDGKPGITMVNTMTDAQVQKVAKDVLKNIIMPGGTSFAYEFNGVTFIVPAGSGSIIIDQETDPGYEYHLAPIGLNETYNLVIGGAKIEKYELLGGNRVRLTIDYSNLPTQTYYLLYLTQEASSGTRGGTRLGKRDKAHGKLYSVGVRPRSITDVNPPSEASGGIIDEEEDPEGVIDNPTPPTPPTGIQTVASESSVNSNKWFTADGRQLESKPTKPGFYIRNGKKVVIK